MFVILLCTLVCIDKSARHVKYDYDSNLIHNKLIGLLAEKLVLSISKKTKLILKCSLNYLIM